MSIDLKQFSKIEEIVLPIVDNWGQYKGQKFFLHKNITCPDKFLEKDDRNIRDIGENETNGRLSPNEDRTNKTRVTTRNILLPNQNRRSKTTKIINGYYSAVYDGGLSIKNEASLLRIRKILEATPHITVYAYGTDGIPTNFDASRRRGFGETIPINFLQESLFTVAEVALYEDGRCYFYETKLSRNNEVIQAVKRAYEEERDLSLLRGVTPELRYYYLLASLQRQGFRAAKEIEQLVISREEKRKRLAELESSFSGRLAKTVQDAGGKLIRFSQLGSNYLIEWSVGGQLLKSTINDEFRIINAGFCLSGDDRRHSMASIINLAKLFQEDAPLYITRE